MFRARELCFARLSGTCYSMNAIKHGHGRNVRVFEMRPAKNPRRTAMHTKMTDRYEVKHIEYVTDRPLEARSPLHWQRAIQGRGGIVQRRLRDDCLNT